MNDAQYAALNRRLDAIEQRIRASSDTTHRVTDRLQRRLYAQIEALIGLYRDIDDLPSLPALRGWAISPDTARVLHELLRTYRPRHVLECGSGASTVLLGHLKVAGLVERVTSLDHDPVFLELTRQRLRSAGLLDEVDLVFAPLVERGIEQAPTTWYDVDVDGLASIDLVIVDGPPTATNALARYPAVSILSAMMNDGCLIVVDDYERPAESDMVTAWRDEYPLAPIVVDRTVEKSLAVLEYRRPPSHEEHPPS